MKKFIFAAVAASVLAAPVAAAPGYGRDDRSHAQEVRGRQAVKTRQVVKVRQVQARNWRKGERFDRRQARNYRVIQNPRAYRLNDAPRGYQWVQSDNNAVLVAITSGIIGAIFANRF
ncbi:MAG TPA: RcnB family protein [Allosphingosinicella sp.]|nr:RcnB family protein [Allosphingosinicella sp.]